MCGKKSPMMTHVVGGDWETCGWELINNDISLVRVNLRYDLWEKP